MKVSRYTDAHAFLVDAESWLLEREAEHNLVIGIAYQLQDSDHLYEQPIYLAIVRDKDAIVGCAFRTPPHKLGLTRMPMAAIAPLVGDVGRVYSSLPAVMGSEDEALAFGQLWTEQHGGTAAVGMRQRIHVVKTVIPPPSPAPGILRRADRAELHQLIEWAHGFASEAGVSKPNREALTERMVEEGSLYVWEDGEARSMLGAVGPTPHGIRIGYVYTPPPFRKRGYASAAVASLSQQLMREGREFCFLYTDLANPTSNAIYRRIGYEPVGDAVDVQITATSDS